MIDMDMPVEGLTFGKPHINTRVQNILKEAKILTLQQLTDSEPWDLIDQRNFGTACMEAVIGRLADLGLKLRGM